MDTTGLFVIRSMPVRSSLKGPFIITAKVLAISGDTVSCRAELRDEGRDGDVVAIAMWQCRAMNSG